MTAGALTAVTGDSVVRDLLAVTDGGGQYTCLTGLVIILLLLVVTVLLIGNMNRRIKRLPREFPKDEPPSEQDERPAPPREG
jgi:hypothetical protein